MATPQMNPSGNLSEPAAGSLVVGRGGGRRGGEQPDVVIPAATASIDPQNRRRLTLCESAAIELLTSAEMAWGVDLKSFFAGLGKRA